MKIKHRAFVLWMLAVFIVSLPAGAKEYPSLWDSFDPDLQRHVESAIEKTVKEDMKEEYRKAVKNKIFSLTVVDVTDLERPKVAAINGDVMMYAASLPKIAILLGAFVEIERGNIKLDDETRAALTKMIRKSSNKDATEILMRVGMPNLAEILQSDRYRLYDPRHNGGLWVGSTYGGGQVWKRDPLHNISHGATAMQVARFYYLAATGRLVAPELFEDFKEIMSKPAIKHKFVKGLQEKTPEAQIYRKSGTWKQFHSDGGVIVQDDYRYIVVSLAEHEAAKEGLSRLIVAVDNAVAEMHEKDAQ